MFASFLSIVARTSWFNVSGEAGCRVGWRWACKHKSQGVPRVVRVAGSKVGQYHCQRRLAMNPCLVYKDPHGGAYSFCVFRDSSLIPKFPLLRVWNRSLRGPRPARLLCKHASGTDRRWRPHRRSRACTVGRSLEGWNMFEPAKGLQDSA